MAKKFYRTAQQERIMIFTVYSNHIILSGRAQTGKRPEKVVFQAKSREFTVCVTRGNPGFSGLARRPCATWDFQIA